MPGIEVGLSRWGCSINVMLRRLALQAVCELDKVQLETQKPCLRLSKATFPFLQILL